MEPGSATMPHDPSSATGAGDDQRGLSGTSAYQPVAALAGTRDRTPTDGSVDQCGARDWGRRCASGGWHDQYARDTVLCGLWLSRVGRGTAGDEGGALDGDETQRRACRVARLPGACRLARRCRVRAVECAALLRPRIFAGRRAEKRSAFRRPGRRYDPRAIAPYRAANSGKSSSRNSLAARRPSFASRSSVWRSSTRRIFPEMVFGRSENSSRRTRLNGASRSRRWRKIDSAVARLAVTPVASTRYAFGTAMRLASGAGTTAASAIAGCSISVLSSSNGLIR